MLFLKELSIKTTNERHWNFIKELLKESVYF